MENINEELKKVLLLMNYNTSNTLSENTEKISHLLTEKGGKPKVKVDAPSNLGKSVDNIGDALGKAKTLKNERKALDSAFDNKVLAKKSQGKSLTKAEISAHKKQVFDKDLEIYANTPIIKDGKSRLPNDAELKEFARNHAVKVNNLVDTKITKLSGVTPTGGKTTGGGTTGGGTTGGGKSTGGKGRGKNETKPRKKRVESKDLTKGKETRWQKFKDSIKTFSRTKTFKYLLIAGGLYLVYKWWMAEGSAPFPDCIGKNIPKEDFEQMVNSGDGSVIISDTGIDAVDRAGGGKFYDDKKFVTGNGKYTGTWADVPGTGVVITISGQEYTMSCEGVIEDEEDTDGGDGGGGGGGGGYTPCSGFPLKQGCQSSDVRKVQECLGIGADGKLGPKTASSIKAKGYSVPLSQSDYDKIVADCGGSSSSVTTTTTLSAVTSDFETSTGV